MSNHSDCTWNCGGTDCVKPVRWTSTPKCQHDNGIFIDVSFWIFTKSIFYCLDCYQQMDAKDFTRQKGEYLIK